MRDRPDAADLLDAACETFAEHLLPLIPDTHRAPAQRIAMAMAIAAREVRAGDEPLRRELAALAELYGESRPAADTREALLRDLRRMNQRLAADLRAGNFEPPEPRRDRVHALLLSDTVQRVRETNPQELKARGQA